MDEIGIEEARSVLGEIVDRARFTGKPTVITRKGKPAAVVTSINWYQQSGWIAAALDVARLYAQYDGAHHKTWVIDQMVRALTGGGGGIVGPPTDEYREFVADAEGEWDEGAAP